jgi:hypothetical protein
VSLAIQIIVTASYFERLKVFVEVVVVETFTLCMKHESVYPVKFASVPPHAILTNPANINKTANEITLRIDNLP